jgi:PilZ domain-containing protein
MVLESIVLERSMEHRWGYRFPTDLPVGITARGLNSQGRVRDVSVSGAFVVSSACVPLLSAIEIVAEEKAGATGSSKPLLAYVVRHAEDGFAIEWREPFDEATTRFVSLCAAVHSPDFTPSAHTYGLTQAA